MYITLAKQSIVKSDVVRRMRSIGAFLLNCTQIVHKHLTKHSFSNSSAFDKVSTFSCVNYLQCKQNVT